MLRSCPLRACEQQHKGAGLLLLCGRICIMGTVPWPH
jgi:hypothetical protein